MTWTCSTCGFDQNEESNPRCLGGCGHVRRPHLRFVFANEKSLTVRVATTFNRQVLRFYVGDEANVVSDPQFSVAPTDTGWLLRHSIGARNPTHVNGLAVEGSGVELAPGLVVTVGPTRLPMTTFFDFA